jgi:hypothetical protein
VSLEAFLLEACRFCLPLASSHDCKQTPKAILSSCLTYLLSIFSWLNLCVISVVRSPALPSVSKLSASTCLSSS